MGLPRVCRTLGRTPNNEISMLLNIKVSWDLWNYIQVDLRPCLFELPMWNGTIIRTDGNANEIIFEGKKSLSSKFDYHQHYVLYTYHFPGMLLCERKLKTENNIFEPNFETKKKKQQKAKQQNN